MDSLPFELITEIMTRVASNSTKDLFNAKFTNRDFFEAAQEDSVYERASIVEIPEIPWVPNAEISAFIERCKEKGNAEAMYRQGMLDFFSRKKQGSGLGFLKDAASRGHVDAIYVYGLVLLGSGAEGRRQGMEVLRYLKGSKELVRRCRERTREFLHRMWVNNKIEINGGNRDNQEDAGVRRCGCDVGRGWENFSDEVECCETCFWKRELGWVCRMFMNS